MATRQFTATEWSKITATLEQDPDRFGFPTRRYGSVIIGSFNIRKLGSVKNRNAATWNFLALICKQFDLLAIQEAMDNLEGLYKLVELLGPDYGMIVSDATGSFPGAKGLAERLCFVFRRAVVQRAEVVSDITYDRSKVIDLLTENIDEITTALNTHKKKLEAYKNGTRKSKPSAPKMPNFLTFIRQPYCVSFRIIGKPGTKPYEFMAINGHLYFGNYMTDRRQEFHALMNWIIERTKQDDKTYFPNFLLLGDLNLDYDNPKLDRKDIEQHLKSYDAKSGGTFHVNFPFLDMHPIKKRIFKTNARLSETFDQIGLFFCDSRLPTFDKNYEMGLNTTGPDYGVFNFVELFSVATTGKKYGALSKAKKNSLVKRFEHKVSDHMPLWLRLPLPE